MVWLFFQVIFQVALAILDANRNRLLSVDDDGEAMTILSEYLDNITNREYDSPFKSAASSIRGTSVGGVSDGDIGDDDGGNNGDDDDGGNGDDGDDGDVDDGGDDDGDDGGDDGDDDGDGDDDDDTDDVGLALSDRTLSFFSHLRLWMYLNLFSSLIASLDFLLRNKLNE
jgi:hypothetical protein